MRLARFARKTLTPRFTDSLLILRKKPTVLQSSCLLFYFGGARSKGFATLRNVSKLQFFDKIGQAKSVGFRLYSAI